MASAAPNTAVPLPTATAMSATIGIAAPPVSTMPVSYTHLKESDTAFMAKSVCDLPPSEAIFKSKLPLLILNHNPKIL